MTTKQSHKVTFDQIQSAIESDRNAGFCLACGEESYSVEPDARGYQCDSCGELRVYGAEEILVMGAYDETEPEKPLIDDPLSQAAIESGRLVITHVGDSPAPEPAKKAPTVRALSIRQILSGNKRAEVRKELYEKTGLLTDGRILLNTKPEQPVSDSFVPLEKPSREMLAEKSRKTVTPGNTSFAEIDGESVQCTGFNDKSGAEVCRVQSAYLKTAEKLTKVKNWRFVEHDVTHRIIGQDKTGRNVAAIACVDYPE